VTDDGQAAVLVDCVRHVYGDRVALDGISFTVRRGELFGLLGPNGGGKSTLFRILATLQRPSAGTARLLGFDVVGEAARVRACLGVVFQNASVDAHLTVAENLRHHGALFGLRGTDLADRMHRLLTRFGLEARRHDLVGRLSGGLARRVELAKGLLPAPAVLLLDEPSAGLDPAARRDLLEQLVSLRDDDGTTIVLTTHQMEEAERCDRLALLDQGRLLAIDRPERLKARVGGDVVTIRSADLDALDAGLRDAFGVEPTRVDGTLRLEHERGHEFLRAVVDRFPEAVQSITFGKPTLEDAFIRLTGHGLFEGPPESAR
jgi:ABC-2 type transport system ATP-binding protein